MKDVIKHLVKKKQKGISIVSLTFIGLLVLMTSTVPTVNPIVEKRLERLEEKIQPKDKAYLMKLHLIKDDKKRRDAFLERFTNTAIKEEQKFGIPVAIKLAQGGLETGWGGCKLSKRNSFFGIKGRGMVVNTKEDRDKMRNEKAEFKIYDTAWESWRDHSVKLLKTKEGKSGLRRYEILFNLDRTDIYHPDKKIRITARKRWITAWAKGLYLLGYATDRNYSKKLLATINANNLWDIY